MRRLRLNPLYNSIIFACLLAMFADGNRTAIAQEAAAEPQRRASLAELVPADVGLCLETDRLAQHVANFTSGPLFERLLHFPPLAKWVGQNGAQIGLAKSEFQKRLGISPAEAWSGILSGRTLFAVWPPAADSADGPAMVLVEAKDPVLLERLLRNFVAMLREAGKWKKTTTLEHSGRHCELHIISGEKGEQLYLAAIDRLAVAANDESLIRETLAMSTGKVGPRGTLATLQGYVRGKDRLSPETALCLFVNPRPWDVGLWADLKRKPPESHDARFQKAMIETWQATDYVIAGIELDSDAAVEAFAAWRTSALPSVVREAAECVSGRAAIAERIPRNALAAVAGRVDWGRLMWRFAPPSRAARGTGEGQPPEVVPGVSAEWLLPASLAHGVGPDFGVYLAPPTDAGDAKHESRLPLDFVAVLQSRPLEPGDGRLSLAKLAEPVLHSLLTSAAAATNAQSGQPAANLETIELDGVAMTSFAGLSGPHGRSLSATYAVVEDDFWLASSPAVLHRGVELTATHSLVNAPPFDRIPSPSHLLYIDLQGVRQLLASSPGIVEFLAASKGLDREAARRSVRELLSLGELADSVSAVVRLDGSGIATCVCIAGKSPQASETLGRSSSD